MHPLFIFLLLLFSLVILFSCILVIRYPSIRSAPHYTVHGHLLFFLANALFLIYQSNALLQPSLPAYPCPAVLWISSVVYPMWLTCVTAYAWQLTMLYWPPSALSPASALDIVRQHAHARESLQSSFEEVVVLEPNAPLHTPISSKNSGLWIILYMLVGVALAQVASTIVVQLYSTNYTTASTVCQGKWEMLPLYAIGCLLVVACTPAVGYMLFHIEQPLYLNFCSAYLGMLALIPIVLILDVTEAADPTIVQVFPLSVWMVIPSFFIHFMVYVLPILVDWLRFTRQGMPETPQTSDHSPSQHSSSVSHKSSEEKSDLSMSFYNMLNTTEERQQFEEWLASQVNKVFRLHYSFYMACYQVRRKYIRRRSLGGDIVAAYEELYRIHHTYIVPDNISNKITAIHNSTRQELVDRFASGRVPTDVFTRAEYEVRDYIMQGAFTQWRHRLHMDKQLQQQQPLASPPEVTERKRRQSLPSHRRTMNKHTKHASMSMASISSDIGIIRMHPSQSFSRFSVDENLLQSKRDDMDNLDDLFNVASTSKQAENRGIDEQLRMWEGPRIPRPSSVVSDRAPQSSASNLEVMPEEFGPGNKNP